MADQIVVVAPTVPMAQIEDFPEGCARSCKGALHLRPGGTKVVTEGELAHLQANHPKAVAGLRVVATTPAKPKPVAKPKLVPKVAAEAVTRAEAAKADSQLKSVPGWPEGRGRGTGAPPRE